MITRIDLQYFKCFEALKLPLSPLTLLSGGNASGKSSVLQALVLLHQSMREQEWSSRLMLNGSTLSLGTASDVIDHEHGERSFELGLVHDQRLYRWNFSGGRKDMSMRVKSVSIDGIQTVNPTTLRNLLPSKHGQYSLVECLQRLTYLSAERLGPKEAYELRESGGPQIVGPKGEHSVSVLHAYGELALTGRLVLPGTPPTLLRQAEARMARFFPGCGLTIEKISRANAVTLGLRTSAGTDFHRPANTGFGLTQVFPIVVAGLAAMSDDLLLIENPEVHIHPAAQAAMGCFLAELASTGVQIIIETHSDHILNGIRRTVKGGVLPHNDVVLHFFRPRRTTARVQSQVETPAIDVNGNIDSWPEGFFDQFDHDMNYFAEWR